MLDSKPARRFSPSPAWLIFGLLVVEGLLWLSERFQWFGFNEKKGWTVLIGVAVVGATMLLTLLWFIARLLFRWRFQFSIRPLLVLTIAVAVPCSWLAVDMKAAREQHDSVEALAKMRGKIFYEWQFDADGNLLPNAQPPGPEWLRNLLGGDFFTTVVGADLANSVSRLANDVSDAGLAHLARLTQLQWLWLDRTKITDTGLVYLKGLTHLKILYLNDTQITDAGLAHLAGLKQLEALVLDFTQITDAGLVYLAGLPQLQRLELGGTKVTDEGVRKLQQALPNCKIER
jgi:hypothetical protein